MPGSVPVQTATVMLDGITYTGTYYFKSSLVCVQYGAGSKATQLGGSTAESIARLLLSELVREERG